MTDQHTNEFPAEPRRPYQGHPYPAPPPPPKPKTRKLTVFLFTATALAVGLIIGGSIGSASGQRDRQATVDRCIDNYTADCGVIGGPTGAPTPAEKPKAEKKSARFGDGTYEVGVDIEPGRYKVTVPADSVMCFYQRLKDDTGDTGSIIAQDVKQPGAKASVTVKKSDGFFETSGCGEWVRQ